MTAPKDWLLREVATGVQKLLCVRLPGAPAADTVKGTILAFGEGLRANGRQWDEARDAPRIRAAFAGLIAECEEWPCPKALLRALPSVYGQAKLASPTTYPLKGDESPEAVRARRAHAARIIAEANRRADAADGAEARRRA